MKKFFKDLREHATKMNNCDKKEMLPLTKKKEKKYKKKMLSHIQSQIQ